ncbi:MAG TPA: tetratricopeptide repeat protein [Kofleriaceae bacterium]
MRELMLSGEAGKETKVSGYVVWVYSCIDAVRQPTETVAQAQKRIDADPTSCQLPRFYLADDMHTPVEQGLWIVDVPRQWNNVEMTRLTPKDRAKSPNRCDKNLAWKAGYCFPLAVGDYVTVTGTWGMQSAHEANSDGLVMFKSLAKATPPVGGKMVAPRQKTSTVKARVVTKRSVPAATPRQRTQSEQLVAEGNRAAGNGDYKKASEQYAAAFKAWPGNHLAMYSLGVAETMLEQWGPAHESLDRALEMAPDQAEYALMAGLAQYHVIEERAQAKRLDPSSVDYSEPAGDLQLALDLDPQLWRAHYYRGRIASDEGRAKDAATEYTLSLQDGPTEGSPWIALCLLYRKWGYPQLAQRVVEQAAQIVIGDHELSEVYFMLGIAHADQLHDTAALEAYDHAVQLEQKNMHARFQRGEVLYRMKRYAEAKADLEAYVKSPDKEDFQAQQATKMLTELATKPVKK